MGISLHSVDEKMEMLLERGDSMEQQSKVRKLNILRGTSHPRGDLLFRCFSRTMGKGIVGTQLKIFSFVTVHPN